MATNLTITRPLVEVADVSPRSGRGSAAGQVLQDVDLTLRENEIVGLLGRSGSGKSTLLRSIAGLLKPSEGQVLFQGRQIEGPPDGVSMVFQSAALFPWLTVQQNVELGLEARKVDAE